MHAKPVKKRACELFLLKKEAPFKNFKSIWASEVFDSIWPYQHNLSLRTTVNGSVMKKSHDEEPIHNGTVNIMMSDIWMLH